MYGIEHHITYGAILLPIVLLILAIMTALAWQHAILATINQYSNQPLGLTSSQLWGIWGYTIILTIVLLLVIWIAYAVAMAKVREMYTCQQAY